MSTSRRSALAMLGLAPAGTAFAIENAIEPEDPPGIHEGRDCRKISEALRRLAESIEKSETYVENFKIETEAAADMVITHKFTINFLYKV